MRGLYVIVDPEACMCEPVLVAQAALRGGCCALQLRDKHNDDRTFARLGLELASSCGRAGVPFIVNDRFWLARELGAQGVHVGQTDTAIETVRKELGAGISIGVSTHSLAQAHDAQARGAQLIGFGPVFATSSKLDPGPVVGIEGLTQVCAELAIPVVAIGGIRSERLDAVINAGTRVAAVISAVCAAPDLEQVERAARMLHAQLS
ncbi:MAG: thiamine phosphate synthase [Pseudomonadota bacterium]|jgi:thiamine-phosphate diphosphorylase